MNMKVIGAAALAAACIAGCCKKDEALVTVNGQSLTRCMLDKDVASLMAARKDQIPADQMEQAKKTFEEQLAQKFLMETLLLGEAIHAVGDGLGGQIQQCRRGLDQLVLGDEHVSVSEIVRKLKENTRLDALLVIRRKAEA